MKRIIGAALIGLVLVGPSAAANLVGDDTMRDYRGWSNDMKVSYLNGFTGLARIVGMECREFITVGEFMAALDYRVFSPDMKLSAAIFQVLSGRGCEVRGSASKPGA